MKKAICLVLWGVLALVAVIVYQRWRISDNNMHLEKFIDKNIRLREKLNKEGIY